MKQLACTKATRSLVECRYGMKEHLLACLHCRTITSAHIPHDGVVFHGGTMGLHARWGHPGCHPATDPKLRPQQHVIWFVKEDPIIIAPSAFVQ